MSIFYRKLQEKETSKPLIMSTFFIYREIEQNNAELKTKTTELKGLKQEIQTLKTET